MKLEELQRRRLARYREAYSLRYSGLTYREIGEQLGVSGNRAWQMVRKAVHMIRVGRTDFLELPR